MAHSHHHHAPDSIATNRAFAIGVSLNLLFVAVEAAYGYLAHSLALLADAGHNLSDVVGLLLAWGGALLAGRASSARRTYGYRKATVMASLASALLLMLALGAIAWEAIGRFAAPQETAGMTVVVVAALGVVVNTLTALLFVRGQRHDLNLRGAFLHMAADAAVSLGVVFAGLVIHFRGWGWVDPTVSLAVVAIVAVATWSLLRDSFNYAVDAVPDNIDIDALRDYLDGRDRVERIHDLHVWPLSTTETALTVHLVVDDYPEGNAFLADIQRHLRAEFGIAHATIQMETANAGRDCLLDDRDCA